MFALVDGAVDANVEVDALDFILRIGASSKNKVLRREFGFLLLARGFSVDITFSSSVRSARLRFCVDAVFLSVFCGVAVGSGLFSGNSDGGANSLRLSGFSCPPFPFVELAGVVVVVVGTNFSKFSGCIGVALTSLLWNESS